MTSHPYAIEAEGLTKRFGTTQALAGIDLAVREGTVLGVLGPNGAGKTTAVRILATLITADRGSARVAGFDVVRDARQVRQTISRLDLAASLVGRPSVIFLDEPTTGLDPAKREDMWEVVRRLVTDGSTVLLTTQYLDEADALADEITVIDHGRVIAHDTPDGLKQIVGGQTLEVRPTDPSRTAEATAILAEMTGGRVESPRRGTLSVSVPDDSALPTTAARLASAGITVTEFSLHLPSLDEVFFTLTGRSASDDESQSDTKEAA
jgi:oleandomycin transport system ATP-binding protein